MKRGYRNKNSISLIRVRKAGSRQAPRNFASEISPAVRLLLLARPLLSVGLRIDFPLLAALYYYNDFASII